MLTNRTHPARPRVCTNCMEGQGRQCACRKRRELTQAEATWLVLVADVAFLLGVAHLVGVL